MWSDPSNNIPRGPQQLPPAHFNPVSASDDELRKFRYPPRPDPISRPKYHTLWKQIASRRPAFVPTKLCNRSLKVSDESKNWSGAVLMSPLTKVSSLRVPLDVLRFEEIIGSWIVPNYQPALNDDGTYKDGDYEFYIWVGLDGWGGGDSLKIGVVLDMTVSDGKVAEQTSSVGVLWRNGSEDEINVSIMQDVEVTPGDLVMGCVWAGYGETTATGVFYNLSTNQWSYADVVAPDGTSLVGSSAQWIVAGKDPASEDAKLFPSYGATVFFYGNAYGTYPGSDDDMTEFSLKDAMMVAAQDVRTSAVQDDDAVIVHSVELVKKGE